MQEQQGHVGDYASDKRFRIYENVFSRWEEASKSYVLGGSVAVCENNVRFSAEQKLEKVCNRSVS